MRALSLGLLVVSCVVIGSGVPVGTAWGSPGAEAEGPDFVVGAEEVLNAPSPLSTPPVSPVVDVNIETYCSANAIACEPPPCLDEGGTGDQQWITVTYADGGTYTGPHCERDEPAEGLTHQQIREAFERVPLPASQIVIQPPDGTTLVNFDTIFTTDVEPFRTTVTILEWTVELDITPAQFAWHFGDGNSRTTTWAGRRYDKNLEVSERNYNLHRYALAPATVSPNVDTTWTARFRVDGGAWQDVRGSVTVTGDPATLEVREAVPALVDER